MRTDLVMLVISGRADTFVRYPGCADSARAERALTW